MSQSKPNLLRRLTGVLGMLPKRRMWLRGYDESLATDAWSVDKIRDFHDRKLVGLVRYAGEHIPFYRELYARREINLRSFRGAVDLPMLPAISKEDLLAHRLEMVRPWMPGLAKTSHTTGGSTGTIATIISRRGIASLEDGCVHALWHRIGVCRGDRMCVLRGSLLQNGRDRAFAEPHHNRLSISTYHLRDEALPKILQCIDDFRPDWLHVYPSAASLLASAMQRSGRRLSHPPRGLLCGSENLFDWQIKLFADVFGGSIYSHYGHGEMALLGGWCENSRSFHFLPNHGYLELLDDNQQPIIGSDSSGEITATGYLNTVMPLIRYRTNDYGAWDDPGPCPGCGRAHQRLVRIDGRIQEYLQLADGTRFPLTNINALHGDFFSLVYRFQFVQDQPGRATLRFIPAVPITPATTKAIADAFAYLERMGLALDYQAVDHISWTRSGKHRMVVPSKDSP